MFLGYGPGHANEDHSGAIVDIEPPPPTLRVSAEAELTQCLNGRNFSGSSKLERCQISLKRHH